MDKTNDQMKGMLFIVFATIGFSFMSFFVKLSGDLPTMQKAFFRNAFALIIAIMTLLSGKQKFVIKRNMERIFCSDAFSGQQG